jgi:protein-S-isoprenylcysteine O-methyltransferase Ste14
MMRATEFEFRNRFWVITAVYLAGFACYRFDHVNAAVAIAEWMVGHPLESARDRHLLQALFFAGAGLALLGAMVRTWGAAYLRSEVVHDHRLHAEALVADGPYRFVRNPLYLGSLPLAVGFGLLASRVGFVVIVAGQMLIYLRLIGREEGLLLERQGESYRAYLARVPRLIPSLTPQVPSGGMKPLWVQAWLGELFMWLFACSLAVWAATLNITALRDLLAVTLGGAVAINLIRRRRRREPGGVAGS